MRKIKTFILFLLAALLAGGLVTTGVFADTNPNSNIQNGAVRRYGANPGQFAVDTGFDEPLGNGEVRLSQKVIADLGNGLFDVELKVQAGDDIKVVPDEALVFLLDWSGSVGASNWATMKSACISMVNSFPSEVNVQFGIVRFGQTARIDLQLTANRASVISGISSLPNPTSEVTNLYDGMVKAQTVLSAYTGNGPKHIVLITDGQPNQLPSGVTGNVETVSLAKVAEVKNSGVYIYAAGFGSVNQTFIKQLASSSEMSFYAATATALVDLLTNPSTGYSAVIVKNAMRKVAVNMGPDIDFVGIISNDGGGASVTSAGGTLYWDPNPALSDLTEARTLVYRIQMKPSALDQGFKPVSSSAVLNYTDAAGRSRTESFDIPKVQMTSAVTVTFVDWDGTVLKTETVNRGAAAQAPVNLSRYGYTFAGWDKGFSNVAQDMTVTALYEINTYTVKFVGLGGETLDEQVIEHGVAAVAPANVEREGYTFIGWDVGFDVITDNLTVNALHKANLVGVTVSAYVEKLNGNKNNLTITVTELYHDGTAVLIKATFSIDNNAAATYNVGQYKVYVDTKGNIQIRACYIV